MSSLILQQVKRGRSRAFVQGYRHGLRLDVADNDRMAQLIVTALEDGYTSGVEALLSYAMEGETIYGRFRDGAQTFGYTLKDNEISYWLLDGSERADSLLERPVWRSDRNPPTKGPKGRKCTKGIKCGLSCINSRKTCRIEPSPQAKQAIQEAKAEIKGQGKGKAAKKAKPKAQKAAKQEDQQPAKIPSESEIAKKGSKIGEGEFGRVYVADGVAYKYGSIGENELEASKQMSELGVGPKILGGKAGESDGSMAMEFLEGYSPISAMDGKSITKEVTAKIYQQVKTMHAAGFHHADLHDGNVLVDESGDVKIIDYGLAGSSSRKASENPKKRSHAELVIDDIENSLMFAFGKLKPSDPLYQELSKPLMYLWQEEVKGSARRSSPEVEKEFRRLIEEVLGE